MGSKLWSSKGKANLTSKLRIPFTVSSAFCTLIERFRVRMLQIYFSFVRPCSRKLNRRRSNVFPDSKSYDEKIKQKIFPISNLKDSKLLTFWKFSILSVWPWIFYRMSSGDRKNSRALLFCLTMDMDIWSFNESTTILILYYK